MYTPISAANFSKGWETINPLDNKNLKTFAP
jgi:hypothetical protein